MKKALIVGIDHYNESIGKLTSAVNDAKKMDNILSTHVSCQGDQEKNFSCRIIVSTENAKEKDQITRTLLKEAIDDLFKDETVDVALLYFSGHGYENSLGGYLVTQDARQYDEGVSFNDIMVYANNSKIKEIIIILDCCMSGNLGNIPIPNVQRATIKNGISILTSSTKGQESFGVNGAGVFTSILCNALEGGNSDILGNVKISHLYEHADRMLGPWDQRPTFKTNASRLSVIRKTEAKLAPSVLLKLTEYFKHQEFEYPLNPTFEHTEENSIAENIEILRNLQKMTSQGLVKPLGVDHMYDAAIQSKPCVLTRSGKQYWRLVYDKQIP